MQTPRDRPDQEKEEIFAAEEIRESNAVETAPPKFAVGDKAEITFSDGVRVLATAVAVK